MTLKILWLSILAFGAAFFRAGAKGVKESRLSERSERYLRRTPQTRFTTIPPPPC